MSLINALLTPVSKEDELRALADSLRKRKRAADFYSATTIKPLQKMAQTESADVIDATKQQGLLREALAQRASDEMRAQAKMAEQQARDAKTDEYRNAQLGLSRAKLAAAGQKADQPRLLKPSAKIQENYLEGSKLMQDVGVINGLFSQMDESQQEELNQPGKEIGLGVIDTIMPDGVSRAVREKYVYKDPKTRDYLAAGNRLTQRLSNLAAGLTVTGYEMKARDTWSPFAIGISQQERQVRLDNVSRDLFGKVKLQEEMYPDLVRLGEVAAQAQASPPVDDLERQAQEAIANGANPEAVRARLEEMRRGQQ